MAQNDTNKPMDISIVRNDFKKMETQIAAALPSHIKPEKFIRVVMTAIQNSPYLLTCDRMSLYNAAMKCAADGLLPDGREAAFVPFKGKIVHMPMVGGICKKARNSGEIKEIDSNVVYENDQYEYWVDENGTHFKFMKARGDRGKPIAAFAYAKTKDNGLFFEEMTEEEIQKVRNMSRSKEESPWNGPFADEMRRKTVIRRLAKYRLPSSTDLDEVVRSDDEMYELDQANKIPSKTQTLTEKLHSQTQEVEMTAEMIPVSSEFEQAAVKAEMDMRMK